MTLGHIVTRDIHISRVLQTIQMKLILFKAIQFGINCPVFSLKSMLQILSTHLIINMQSKDIKTFERNHEKSSKMQGFNLTI